MKTDKTSSRMKTDKTSSRMKTDKISSRMKTDKTSSSDSLRCSRLWIKFLFMLCMYNWFRVTNMVMSWVSEVNSYKHRQYSECFPIRYSAKLCHSDSKRTHFWVAVCLETFVKNVHRTRLWCSVWCLVIKYNINFIASCKVLSELQHQSFSITMLTNSVKITFRW
jgi:hypothetical protein